MSPPSNGLIKPNKPKLKMDLKRNPVCVQTTSVKAVGDLGSRGFHTASSLSNSIQSRPHSPFTHRLPQIIQQIKHDLSHLKLSLSSLMDSHRFYSFTLPLLIISSLFCLHARVRFLSLYLFTWLYIYICVMLISTNLTLF